jgi:hypothetical protein
VAEMREWKKSFPKENATTANPIDRMRPLVASRTESSTIAIETVSKALLQVFGSRALE